ncbi:MAG: protein kinase [Planctomycetes bacterium]|nr:protein kinase [Planctomycetota bacterium]
MTGGGSEREDRLEQLVADALHELEQGHALDLDALCADDPELKSAVAETIALAGAPGYRLQTKAAGSLAGQVFGGRYVLTECIGSGAMGAVYRADDLDLGRTVAIKCLRTELLHGKENERRFEREGEVLARLSHPSIAAIYDRKRSEDGAAYIVMQYVDGISMQHALENRAALGKDGCMPVREAVEHATQLARALELVHENGIVHRDIKPSNIMLSSRGPVLIDFGIAALGAHETLAEGTRGVGTPAYMAPEQLRSDAPAGPSVDIYGLTASLYRALTGKAPYEGTPAEVLGAIPLRDPTLPATLRPDLPRDLLAILDVGLNRDPSQRYASMRGLREDLEAFLAHAPVRARYPGALARFGRRVRRSPAALAASAVALAFAIGLLGFWGYGEYERDRRARMQRAHDEASAQLQPMLTLWNPADRAMPDDEARRREFELLDRAVANALQPLPTLATRAAFRWDQDRREDAVADIETLARRLPGPVTAFLAEAYRDAVAAEAAAPVIDGAPVPTTAEDVYLLAFHELRRRNFRVARDLLFDPRLDAYDPALEQRLLIEMDGLDRRPVEECKAKALEAHAAILRMEERCGRTTAMTAHLRGVALLYQQLYEQALAAIFEGLRLAPHSANLHENAGVALRRLGGLDAAAEHLSQAIALRPHTLSAYRTLFWVHLMRSQADRPEAWQQAVDLLESPAMPDAWRDRLRGELDLDLAIGHLLHGEPQLSRESADAALTAWQRSGGGDEFKVAVATCLSEGRQPFADLAALAADEPSQWYRTLITLGLMPEELGQRDTEAIKTLLLALVREKAPRAAIDTWLSTNLPSKR